MSIVGLLFALKKNPALSGIGLVRGRVRQAINFIILSPELTKQLISCSLLLAKGRALAAFITVFGFGFFDSLPLQVLNRVGAVGAKRRDVVSDPARTLAARLVGGRAGVLALKRRSYRRAAVLAG